MDRTLRDVTYSDGIIASGKCSGCGQVFTTSPVPLVVGENIEWNVIAAFGAHECIPASLKPITYPLIPS